jgi:hypothetical protein
VWQGETSDDFTCRASGSIPTLVLEEYAHGLPIPTAPELDARGPQSLSSHSNNDSQNPSHRASVSPAISAIIHQDVSSYFLETNSSIETSNELVFSSNPSPLPSPDESPYGSPRAFGGILTSVNTLYSLPIKQTSRNAELLHYCMLKTLIYIRLILTLVKSTVMSLHTLSPSTGKTSRCYSKERCYHG